MKRSFLLILLAPLVVAGSLHAAAVDYLLEIDGIKGESSDDRHAQSVEIGSFSWSSTNSASSGGGGGAGKVSFSDMHFTTKLSKASPQLLLACASTNRIPRATLFVRRAGTQEEYYKIELQDCLVTSYQTSGHASAAVVPTDQFSLNFTKVTFVHTGLDGAVTTATVVRTPPQ